MNRGMSVCECVRDWARERRRCLCVTERFGGYQMIRGDQKPRQTTSACVHTLDTVLHSSALWITACLSLAYRSNSHILHRSVNAVTQRWQMLIRPFYWKWTVDMFWQCLELCVLDLGKCKKKNSFLCPCFILFDTTAGHNLYINNLQSLSHCYYKCEKDTQGFTTRNIEFMLHQSSNFVFHS